MAAIQALCGAMPETESRQRRLVIDLHVLPPRDPTGSDAVAAPQRPLAVTEAHLQAESAVAIFERPAEIASQGSRTLMKRLRNAMSTVRLRHLDLFGPLKRLTKRCSQVPWNAGQSDSLGAPRAGARRREPAQPHQPHWRWRGPTLDAARVAGRRPRLWHLLPGRPPHHAQGSSP